MDENHIQGRLGFNGDNGEDDGMGMEFEHHNNPHYNEDISSKVESAEKRDSVASLTGGPKYNNRQDYIKVYQ